jgi:renalase
MSEEIYDCAIIGAGVSGLAAAQHLHAKGVNVVVVEKSRGVGGRAATRRLKIGLEGEVTIEVPVDHGAQFFTARDIRFQDQVAHWQERGVCFPWSEGFFVSRDGELYSPDSEFKETRYACRAGMTSLCKDLAKDIKIIPEFQVASVVSNNDIWFLHADSSQNAEPVRARSLIVSAPLPQAVKLVGDYFSSEEHAFLDRVKNSPCVAVMAFYDRSVLLPSWKGIKVKASDSKLSWIGWDSSRRGSDMLGRVAVLHGSKDFSNHWLTASDEELRVAGADLLQEAACIPGDWIGRPSGFTVHRWRYAHLEGPCAPGGFLHATSTPSLYLIGDGVNGGRIEGAWLSGVFAADDYLIKQAR